MSARACAAVYLVGMSLVLGGVASCGDQTNSGKPSEKNTDGQWSLDRQFPSQSQAGFQFDGCLYSSPMAFDGVDGTDIVALGATGTLAGLDPASGQARWTMALPTPGDKQVLSIAQPARIDDHRIVVAYMTVPADAERFEPNIRRLGHRVVVVDVAAHMVDPAFGSVKLQANMTNQDGDQVAFRDGHALDRPDVVVGKLDGDTFGKAYVTSGNARDIQPWHGWAFEVDLDAWKATGAESAVTSTFVVTPEPNSSCGPEGSSGSRERQCGGGLWAPSGPLVLNNDDGYELILAAGNGKLDLNRQDYANTLMRTGPGLDFEPGCDAQACADFDPDAPSRACMESCDNLWIPRLTGQDDQPPTPADGRCDGLTLFECWQELDYIGGSTPAYVETGGFKTLSYPTKDGHLYLIDQTHLGRQFDRLKLVDQCGTPDDPCQWDWAGMAVTKPVVAREGDRPILLVPTFMPDHTHPAGVVAVTIEVGDDGPRYKRLWEFPDFDDPAATERFRHHPSRMALSRLGDDGPTIAWIVEPGEGAAGRLVGLDISDGRRVFGKDLAGSGWKYTVPLVDDDTIYLSSCQSDVGPGHVEAFELTNDE